MHFKIFKYIFQILNVYITKYESGGQFWPIAHNTTIFSLVLSQIIALGVFGIKESSVASGFTIPLIICTLLFNEYCRQRFLPTFKNNAAEVAIPNGLSLSPTHTPLFQAWLLDCLQVLIEMDRKDELCGRMEETYRDLHTVYCQFTATSHELCRCGCLNHRGDVKSIPNWEKLNPGLIYPTLGRLPLPGIKLEVIGWLSLFLSFSGKDRSQLKGSLTIHCNLDIEETSKK